MEIIGPYFRLRFVIIIISCYELRPIEPNASLAFFEALKIDMHFGQPFLRICTSIQQVSSREVEGKYITRLMTKSKTVYR